MWSESIPRALSRGGELAGDCAPISISTWLRWLYGGESGIWTHAAAVWRLHDYSVA